MYEGSLNIFAYPAPNIEYLYYKILLQLPVPFSFFSINSSTHRKTPHLLPAYILWDQRISPLE